MVVLFGSGSTLPGKWRGILVPKNTKTGMSRGWGTACGQRRAEWESRHGFKSDPDPVVG